MTGYGIISGKEGIDLNFRYRSLITSRLKLRRPYLSDTDDLFLCTGNPRVTRYEGWKPHGSPMETFAFLNNLCCLYDDGFCYDFIIEEKRTRRAVGAINLHDIDFTKDVGYIGYWLAEDVWGMGYGSEAAAAFVSYFLKKARIREIRALCHPQNIASRKILEKTGFTFIGEKEDSAFRDRPDETRSDTVLEYQVKINEFSSKVRH